MLSLLFVQVSAAVSLVATLAGILLGLSRRRRLMEPARVVAKRDPPRWTEVVWLLGTTLALLWPVGIFLLPAYAYHWPSFPDFPGSWFVQILGVVLGIAGGLLFSRAARALGTQMTPAIQLQQGHQLLQSGPYRLIRHPVYTAILAIAIGQTLLFLSPLAALLTLVMAGLAEYRAHLEEDLLRSPEGFGATYDAYMARTGRFLPRLRSKS
ncbi:MAG: isoprenylcysteine carboxylmethyltransferase family protein [Thermoplasmata archaeon]